MKKRIGFVILAVILFLSAGSAYFVEKQSLTEHQKAWISDLEGPFKELSILSYLFCTKKLVF